MFTKALSNTYYHCRWLCLLSLCYLNGCSLLSNDNREQIKPEQLEVPMLFVTNRQIESNDKVEVEFTKDRGELHYGTIHQRVDTDEVLDSRYATWQRWLPSSDKKINHPQICKTFWLENSCISNIPRSESPKEVLLFIHGTGRSFEKSAKHMANLLVEIDFKGLPILYSWPTGNHGAGYVSDRSNTRWSSPYLFKTLNDLINSGQFDSINIVAHSLGNRLLLKALEQLVIEQSPINPSISNIVMIAPDVDTDLFIRDYIPVLNQFQAQKSLYVSSEDIPLKLSTWINGQNRLGDGNSLVFKKIETIDVSEVHSSFTAHSSYRKNKIMQEDLHQLLIEKLSASYRDNIRKQKTQSGFYWQLYED